MCTQEDICEVVGMKCYKCDKEASTAFATMQAKGIITMWTYLCWDHADIARADMEKDK